MAKQIALLIESSSVYGRDLLSGVLRYVRAEADWSINFEQGDLSNRLPTWIDNWDGDGIISRITNPALIDLAKRSGVAVVDLTDRTGESPFPLVRSDDKAIGEMGARHLLERGFVNFAFCGAKNEAWSERREIAFSDLVMQHGGTCQTRRDPWYNQATEAYDQRQQRLASWIATLDKPIGIMACNDGRGRHVLDACERAGVDVPEQVAVIGVDNDELLCQMSRPPLSSVIPSANQVGFEAAALLTRMMAGKKIVKSTIEVRPLDVQTRQSTDVIAIDDPQVARAMRYVRDHACQGLSVACLVNAVSISRSKLERDFRAFLGRSPQEEIRRAQVTRARELLLSTELPVDRISQMCGFKTAAYFYVVFKQLEGTTPTQFRESKPNKLRQ